MELSNSLIKRFTEATRDKSDATAKTEAYGTVQSDGSVVLDGASSPTPCSNTVSMNPGDRVIVKIVNHQAVVTGNLTSEALDATATDERIESKMEDVIEVVDEQGTRITQVESTVTQQADQIATKVSQTDFDSLGNRVSTAESTITQQAGQIASKVSQTDFDTLGNRVTSAESSITQQATQIASKVSQSDFDALGNRVTTAESNITQQAGQISSKVSQSDFNSLSGRVSTAESTITQQAGLISTKVSAGDIASSINQTAQSVKISASKIDIDGIFTVNDYFKVLQQSGYYNWIEVNGHKIFDDDGYIVYPDIYGNVNIGIYGTGTWDSSHGDYRGVIIHEYEAEETAALQIYCDTRGNVIVAPAEYPDVCGIRIGTENRPMDYVRSKNIVVRDFSVPQMLSGTTSITPSAANTPTKKSISFGATFASAPVVTATYIGTAPGTVVTGVSVNNVTKTGFDLYVTRTSTTSTSIGWIAVGAL